MAHARDRRHVVDFRWRCRFGSCVRSAAEQNNLCERVEAEKIGFVERAHAGLAEPAGNAHRHPADAHRFAESDGQCAAGDQTRSSLPRLDPAQHRKVLRRVERDQSGAIPFDQRWNDPLRRHTREAGNSRNALREVGGERLVRGLHGEQTCGDVYQRRARYHEEVGAHAREALRHALPQRPAGDEARKADTDPEHHGGAEKHRAQPAAADVLRSQPDQQPTIVPAFRHTVPRGE